MSFRSRPRTLLLRRTSSCSSLALGGLFAGAGGNRTKLPSKDWACNDGAPPAGKIIGVTTGKGDGKPPPPTIVLEPLREGAVEHITLIEEPDPKCHFCEEHTSRPVHENCTRLKIVSRGACV